MIGTREWDCERDGHTWVGGMCYVHDEDAESTNAERLDKGLDPLECERCEAKYGEDE